MKIIIFLSLLGIITGHPFSECNPNDVIYGKLLQIDGCFNLHYSDELFTSLSNCFMKSVNEFVKRIMMNKLDDKFAEKFLEEVYSCHLADFGFEDQLTKEKISKFLDKNYITGEDIEVYKDLVGKCAENIMGKTHLEQVARFDNCLSREMMSVCGERGESVGALPLLAMITSLNLENNDCDNAVLPKRGGEYYNACLKNPGDLSFLKFQKAKSHPIKNMIFETILETPTIQTFMCTGKKMGLLDDEGKADYIALANYVNEYENMNSNVKNKLVNGMKMCGEEANKQSDPLKREFTYQKCAVPLVTSTCGFDSMVTHSLYPLLNKDLCKQFASEIKAVLLEKDFVRKIMTLVKMYLMKLEDTLEHFIEKIDDMADSGEDSSLEMS